MDGVKTVQVSSDVYHKEDRKKRPEVLLALTTYNLLLYLL